MAGRGARRGGHGHSDARHRRGRRSRARRTHLARHDRHGGRVRPHHRGAGRCSVPLWQPGLSGAVRFRHRSGADGARGHRQWRCVGLSPAASSDAEFSAKAVYNLAIQGDEEAQKIFRRVGRALGIALSDLVNALNLPMYVVGGGVSSAWEAFSPAIFEELRQRSMVYAATAPASVGDGHGASARVEPGGSTKTIITRSLLGTDAGLYGAARMTMVNGP